MSNTLQCRKLYRATIMELGVWLPSVVGSLPLWPSYSIATNRLQLRWLHRCRKLRVRFYRVFLCPSNLPIHIHWRAWRLCFCVYEHGFTHISLNSFKPPAGHNRAILCATTGWTIIPDVAPNKTNWLHYLRQQHGSACFFQHAIPQAEFVHRKCLRSGCFEFAPIWSSTHDRIW